MSEIVTSNWIEDTSRAHQIFTPALLSTTASSLIFCFALCFKENSCKAVTYNDMSQACHCYDGLTGQTPETGHRLWNRVFQGYTLYSPLGIYTKIVNDEWITHDAAEARCAENGAKLMVLDTTDKISYITGSTAYVYNSYYHIGATDRVQEDNFLWNTGSVVSRDAALWEDQQPDNNLGNQDCMVIFAGKFDDVFCSDEMNYICEII